MQPVTFRLAFRGWHRDLFTFIFLFFYYFGHFIFAIRPYITEWSIPVTSKFARSFDSFVVVAYALGLILLAEKMADGKVFVMQRNGINILHFFSLVVIEFNFILC